MFTFKFERLLNIKDNLLSKNILELSEINKKVMMTKSKIKDLRDDNKKRIDKLNDMLNEDVLNNSYLIFTSENIYKTMKDIDVLSDNLSKLNMQKREKLSEIKELRKEKKQVEKLKEKQYKKYTENENKKETRFLDEIATIKYANKNSY